MCTRQPYYVPDMACYWCDERMIEKGCLTRPINPQRLPPLGPDLTPSRSSFLRPATTDPLGRWFKYFFHLFPTPLHGVGILILNEFRYERKLPTVTSPPASTSPPDQGCDVTRWAGLIAWLYSRLCLGNFWHT
ncbi:hypothetical protein E2C01_060405 [Portunus trituberculatus]|uniref:Uncharacterized protein n=1 Tax=Portunus trituberculatus TaxID=210409 RepID=A0A5B7HBB3_PORTR|nr:hypothetical protein [Portunus trituberculatus]